MEWPAEGVNEASPGKSWTKKENLGQKRKILDKKADYIIALKGNQGTPQEDAKVFAAEQKANGFRDTTISRHETVDGDHGRIETRTRTAIHDVAWLQERHDWPGLKGVVMVESQREIEGKVTRETRFYITSLVLLANEIGPMIRDHWAIESAPQAHTRRRFNVMN